MTERLLLYLLICSCIDYSHKKSHFQAIIKILNGFYLFILFIYLTFLHLIQGPELTVLLDVSKYLLSSFITECYTYTNESSKEHALGFRWQSLTCDNRSNNNKEDQEFIKAQEGGGRKHLGFFFYLVVQSYVPILLYNKQLCWYGLMKKLMIYSMLCTEPLKHGSPN